MRFAASLSTHPDAPTAVGEIVGELLEALGEAPDVCMVFVSGEHALRLDEICGVIRSLTRVGVFVGAAARGTIGGVRQIVEAPAISVWAALTDAATPLRLTIELDGREAVVKGIDHEHLDQSAALVLLSEAAFPLDPVLTVLGERHPHLAVVGGVADSRGSSNPRFVVDDDVFVDGAIGLLLGPSDTTAAITSQGAWPVGEPMVVTDCDGSTLRSLAGRPATDHVDNIVLGSDRRLSDDGLDRTNHIEGVDLGDHWADADPDTIRRHLRLGVVREEHDSSYTASDFVVYPLGLVDRLARTIDVDADIDTGTIVQFHLAERSPSGAGLATALGYGGGSSALVFGSPHTGEAAGLFERGIDTIAGMVCDRQIGPIGRHPGRPHLFKASNTALIL